MIGTTHLLLQLANGSNIQINVLLDFYLVLALQMSEQCLQIKHHRILTDTTPTIVSFVVRKLSSMW